MTPVVQAEALSLESPPEKPPEEPPPEEPPPEEPLADLVTDGVASTAPSASELVPEPVVREPERALERVTIPAEPPEKAKEPETPAVKSAPVKVSEPLASGTSLGLRGVARGYVVDSGGKQHALGALAPGKYKVYAFFDASKATQVLEVELRDGQGMMVNCDPGIRMCRAK
jgi:hypothetical protein